MSAIDSLIRLHRWQLDDRRRNVAELEKLLEKLRNEVQRLDQELAAEQAAASRSLEAAAAYPAFAQALAERRAKITNSIRETEEQILRARDLLAEAFQEVKRYELAAANRSRRSRQAIVRKQTIEQDELALQMHRRRQGSGGD